MSITLTQLRAFLAVVQSGSVTAAADELIVTQSSVSAAVSALARELGTPLLERDGRGVRPTPAGAAFAPFAADVIGLLAKGRRAAVESAEARRGRCASPLSRPSAESFVPRLMQAFATAHPDVGLTLNVGNREQVMGLVLAHEADVAFAGRPPRDVRLEARALHPNEHLLITAPDDPLAAGELVAPDELADRTWLLREPGSGTRSVNEEFLIATGLAPPHPHGRLQRRDQAGGSRRAGPLASCRATPSPTISPAACWRRSRSPRRLHRGRGMCCPPGSDRFARSWPRFSRSSLPEEVEMRPPVPPFTEETARQKVQAAEDAWNTRDPDKVAAAYTVDSVWRNRDTFVTGREEIAAFLRSKWDRELEYALRKDLWAYSGNRIAVRFQYESRDASGQWWRSYGNEQWEFDEEGYMRRREASINDVAISESERRIFGARPESERDDSIPLR